MNSLSEEYGLYWQPLGGNNIDQISGHSYRYTDVTADGRTTIIVDLGKFDNHQALGIKIQRPPFLISGHFSAQEKIEQPRFF